MKLGLRSSSRRRRCEAWSSEQMVHHVVKQSPLIYAVLAETAAYGCLETTYDLIESQMGDK